jgi:hypothetical protein
MKLPRCAACKYPQGNSNHSIYALFKSLVLCVFPQKCNEGIGLSVVFIHDGSTKEVYFQNITFG